MARVLVAGTPHTGHVRPLLPIISALAERGHEVAFYSSSIYLPDGERRGATPVRMVDGIDYDETTVEQVFGERTGRGLRQLQRDVSQIFESTVPGYLSDLRRFTDDWVPDVLVSDCAYMPGILLGELRDIPLVSIGVIPLFYVSADTPPFGPGVPYKKGPAARVRNRAANALVMRLIFGPADANMAQHRADVGLPPRARPFLNWPFSGRVRHLQLSAPELEYPRRDLPANIEFVGPIVPPPAADWEQPDWWGDLEAARAQGRPVVVVTQGTVRPDPEELVRTAVRGLLDEDVFVVVTSPRMDPEETLPQHLRRRPDGSRAAATVVVEPFVPFDRLLPLTDVLVTNGGYGGLGAALAQGVPLVTCGMTEDKAETGARVRYAGVGVSVRSQPPSPAQVRAAVRQVLDGPGYGARARALQASGAAGGGLGRIVEVVEEEARLGA